MIFSAARNMQGLYLLGFLAGHNAAGHDSLLHSSRERAHDGPWGFGSSWFAEDVEALLNFIRNTQELGTAGQMRMLGVCCHRMLTLLYVGSWLTLSLWSDSS